MATLVRSSYNIDSVHVVGVPLLVNSPAAYYTINSTAPVTVFGSYTGADFIANPYNLSPTYPLRLQLYFSSIVLTGTVTLPKPPEYYITVTGPFETYSVHRFDEKDFGTTHFISDWASKTVLVTVKVNAISPITGVTMQCFAGVAVENVQDRSEEF